MVTDTEVERALRRAAPSVLGALLRRYNDFAMCEDAVQEALIAAYREWPGRGFPHDSTAWLITVAHRRLLDQLRSDQARARRETRQAELSIRDLEGHQPGAASGTDDTLTLLAMCCHPALSPISQIALTLRAVGGLSTAQIARAFFVSDASMSQRITRAKQAMRTSDHPAGAMPTTRTDPTRAVQHVLYLIFNEGYLTSSGPELQRSDLAVEGIRLARMLVESIPADGEAVGLLALMLLLDSRRAARTDPDGALIALADQDRALWDRASIDEGTHLITDSLSRLPLGPYQVQAAITALHAEAPSFAQTDWAQIVALYDTLQIIAPNPMAAMGHAVALSMLQNADAGLGKLALLDDDERLVSNHRLHAVRAHLHERRGDDRAAHAGYLTAAALTTSETERAYLQACAARLDGVICQDAR